MKKLLVALMIASLLFVLFSCTDSTAKTPETSSITLNTTNKTAGGEGDETLKWEGCEIAAIEFTQGSDGFVLSDGVDVTFSSDASITITAYTDSENNTGTALTNEAVSLKLEVGGSEGSWTLKSTITANEGTDLSSYTSYVMTITDKELTFTYTPDSENAEPIIVATKLDTTYTRITKATATEPQETKTTLTIASKESGGGSDQTLKWTGFELATIDVAAGTDGFEMSSNVDVTLGEGTTAKITAYTEHDASGNGKELALDTDVTIKLYVGGSEGSWTLKADITDIDNGNEPIANGTYNSYKIEISDGTLIFKDTNNVTVTATATIEYTRKTASS